VSFYFGDDEEGGAGYGTGDTLSAAVQDALTDYEESSKPSQRPDMAARAATREREQA
jgi:hypothetical protein